MRIIDYSEAPHVDVRRSYKCNTWSGMLAISVIMGCITLFVALPKGEPIPTVMLVFPVILTLLFIGIFLNHLQKCRKEKNWLLKEIDGALIINLRSIKNNTKDHESHKILLIPDSEIAGIGKTLEHRKLPFYWMRENSVFAYLDIYLKEHVNCDDLNCALANERRLYANSHTVDCPIRIHEPGVIRLHWNWIFPREDKALLLLGENYGITPTRKVYTLAWDDLQYAEKEGVMDQLWEWGEVERAYMLASSLYKIPEKKARRILSERNLRPRK